MAQKKIRSENNFTGGVNNEQSSVFVDDSESTDEYGWDFDEYPNRTVRKGKLNYGASGGAQTNLLTNFKTSQLVRAVGASLQYNASGTWSSISGSFTDTDWDATNFEVAGADALILTNGSNAVQYWNGTTLTALSGSAPTGKYITADPSRVFIAKGDTLYWCGFQNAQDWTSSENSGLAQYYTYGGGDITALYNFKDIKYVWKENAMAGLYGTSYFDYRLMEVSNNIGCVSHKTVQEVNGILFWLGAQNVYMFTQGNPIPIGNKIRGYLDRINTAHTAKSCAFTDGLRYYLCIPIDSATEPNIRLVWDTRYNQWRVCAQSENFRYGALFNNKVYAGNSSGQTMQINVGTTDNGTAIPWSITSKAFNEGVGEAEKEYKEIHFQGEFPSGTSFTLGISTVNEGSTFTTLDYDPTGTASTAQNKNIIIPLDTTPLAYWFRYQLSGSGPASFYSVQRYFRVCRVQH